MTGAAAVHVAYTPGYLAWQLGEGHPTNPERARLSVELLRGLADQGLPYTEHEPVLDWERVKPALLEVHDPGYVARVRAGLCGEWEGTRPDLGAVAGLMFQGTLDLAEQLLESRAAGADPAVWFNPQGAKHHAKERTSGGFCVFNDMAWAAVMLSKAGLRVAYLDWDAHHGDGVEAILADRPDLLTISIHEQGIYPYTGNESNLAQGIVNFPLAHTSGDRELEACLTEIEEILLEHRPDVILMAIGADGLEGDPLSSLEFSVEGLAYSGLRVGRLAGQLRADVLVGGAGGYQPLTKTPIAWASSVQGLALGLVDT